MDIGFYFIKDNFLNKINQKADNQNLVGLVETTRHIYLVLPYNNELWAIPLSSKYEKYKKWYDEAKKSNRKNRFLIFVNIMGKDGVLLIQNAFPISEEYIHREVFNEDQQHMNLKNTLSDDVIKLIVNRLKTMIIYHDKNILKFHADIETIREFLKNKR